MIVQKSAPELTGCKLKPGTCTNMRRTANDGWTYRRSSHNPEINRLLIHRSNLDGRMALDRCAPLIRCINHIRPPQLPTYGALPGVFPLLYTRAHSFVHAPAPFLSVQTDNQPRAAARLPLCGRSMRRIHRDATSLALTASSGGIDQPVQCAIG